MFNSSDPDDDLDMDWTCEIRRAAEDLCPARIRLFFVPSCSDIFQVDSRLEGPVILQIRYPPRTLLLAGQNLIRTCFELINA